MGEFSKFLVHFFQAWKRKIGLVTLLMASLFMVGWVRSFFYHEGFTIPSRTKTASHSIWSNQDGLSWVKELSLDNPDHWKDNQVFQWGSRRQNGQSVFDAFGTNRNKWLGFEVVHISYRHINLRSGPTGDPVQMIVWIVPYWAIVLPLTTVSVWLLLPKRRKSTSKTIPEPITNEAA
jgi:hypothetical protein